MQSNLLIVISGPSGVGKGTIVEKLTENGDILKSVSCTTRAPRGAEREGRDYFFITSGEFNRLIANGGLLEFSEHFGNFYGTPAAAVINGLRTSDVILEIDINGALSVKDAYPQAVLILIAPPDRNSLIRRLTGRNTESAEQIQKRTARAMFELENYHKYDYVVINDDLNKAIDDVKSIIRSEKLKSANMQSVITKILEV